MSDPIWLSPLSHDVPWAGLPQPEAPPLWACWCGLGERVCPDRGLHTATEDHTEPGRAGWVEVPRVEHRDGGTT